MSNDHSINDLLEHKCPFFFRLKRIYGTRPNIRKVAGSDSGGLQDSRNVVGDALSTIPEGKSQSPAGLFDSTKAALLQDTQSTSHSIYNVDDEGPTRRNWKYKTRATTEYPVPVTETPSPPPFDQPQTTRIHRRGKRIKVDLGIQGQVEGLVAIKRDCNKCL
ncbi:hypothetical protein RUND412_008519 [Rhizina undulata]